MRDRIAAAVRTGVQFAVTAGLSYLASKGIEIDPEIAGSVTEALHVAAFAIVLALWTALQNYLETKFPFLVKLFSLGTAEAGPRYTTET